MHWCDNPILPRVTEFLSGGWRKFSCRCWPDQSELRSAAGFVSRQPWRACWELRRAVECCPPEYYNINITISNVTILLQYWYYNFTVSTTNLHCLVRWPEPRTLGEGLWLVPRGSCRWDISPQRRCLYCRPGGEDWSLLFPWLPPWRTRRPPASRRAPETKIYSVCRCQARGRVVGLAFTTEWRTCQWYFRCEMVMLRESKV